MKFLEIIQLVRRFGPVIDEAWPHILALIEIAKREFSADASEGYSAADELSELRTALVDAGVSPDKVEAALA